MKRFEPIQAAMSRLVPLLLLAGLFGGAALPAAAESPYAAAWGPALGTSAPLLAATDQSGKSQTLDTLKGPNGLLFVFNRSVDW